MGMMVIAAALTAGSSSSHAHIYLAISVDGLRGLYQFNDIGNIPKPIPKVGRHSRDMRTAELIQPGLGIL